MQNIIVIQNSCFLCEYVLNCNLFLWSKLNFQHHYSSLQCHMIFRNHSNMLICCSRNISDYYQCWKQLCCPIFLGKLWYILFFRIHRWIESSKEQHLFEIEIFCYIINVSTVTFDQFNASLMNKSNNFLKNQHRYLLWAAGRRLCGRTFRFQSSSGVTQSVILRRHWWKHTGRERN